MTETSSAAASPTSRTERGHDVRVRREGELGDSAAPIIQVSDLQKSYKTARGELNLFHGLNLQVEPGEMVAIVGQSGTGKSTLLHILGALDVPSAGTVYCASTNVAQLGPRQAAAFRNREIGYVWQFHYLLPEFTALENVAMPLLARGSNKQEALAVAETGSRKLAWKTAQIIAPASFRAVSSSALRWPGRWSTTLACCWPTSLPATWTKAQPGASSTCSSGCT
jgi:ABC-type glutathione transport system ATPase component